MSRIPYVIQEDSPNLVIVPTESCYEPSPKKTKDNSSSSDSSTKVLEDVQASEKSALVKNAGVKVNPRISSVNKNVLIDVSGVKRQQNSWATNFLQSIGGSASKLPRAYNWHSSASKPAILRNEIHPITYLPNAHPEVYANTTQLNAKTEAIQQKSIKELTPAKTNTIASRPQPINDFSSTKRTNETIKSKSLCFPTKPIKETHQPIDIALYLPNVNKESGHLRAIKEVTQLKKKNQTDQIKSAKTLTHLKSNKESALIIASKKINHTKATIQTKVHKESTQLRITSGTSQTKFNNKATEPKVHKANFKETAKSKPSKSQMAEANRESIALKKIKVEGKKPKESSSNKDTKSKEVNSKEIRRESSKSRKSTSPLRSVVKKVKNYILNSPQDSHECELDRDSHNFEEICNKDCDIDLRAKLKRRAPKNETNTEDEGRDKRLHNTIFPKTPVGKGFVPDDNLIISFENENGTEEVIEKIKPAKAKTRKHQSGGNKYKKIKLEINIVFKNKSDTSDDESSKRGDKEDYESFPDNNDLSFLDDFNVDEIVESLNDCQANIVKTGNSNNFTTNEQKIFMEADLPTSADENAVILNEESIPKVTMAIENNNTICNDFCNEKSLIKTENKASELIMEVQSPTDHNCGAKTNNDNSELESKNMLEPERYFEAGKGETDKSSNAIEVVKTEIILNDANHIKEESSEDHNVINSDNIEKLSEPVILNAEPILKPSNILTCTNITPNGGNRATPSAKLISKTSNSLHNKNAENCQTTNIDNDKHVKNLTSGENVTLPNDKNKGKTKDRVKQVESSNIIDNSQHKDDVILLDDSDEECYTAEDKRTQCLVGKNTIDLTSEKYCSLDAKPKEDIPVDAVKSITVETDSEPILILDTDYDELKAIADLRNAENITNLEKDLEPIDIIKKHLFRHSDDQIHASDKIKQKQGINTLSDHTINTETKSNHDKNKNRVMANKAKVTNDIAPVDTAHCLKAGQDQAKTNKQDQEEKPISPANTNEDISITLWLERQISQDIEELAKTKTERKKNGKVNAKEKTGATGNKIEPAKENRDTEIRMWVVNKGDTRSNTVIQNQPKTNPQDTKDCKPKTVDDMNTQNVSAKCQPKAPNESKVQVSVENKTNMLAKGDPRKKPNQTKTNSPDGKPKPVNNVNSQNENAKYQPKAPNKYNPQAKSSNLTSELTCQNLLQDDTVARRLECRMRVYFGAKILITDLIHSGEFSTIYRFNDGSGTSKTVKQIKSSWQMGASKEAMMMRIQNGIPESNYNCVRHYRGFSESGLWCYVMEYYPKNLQEVMNINNRSFHIDQVQEFSRQLVAAVTILRNNNIIHSDINPLHILINDSETRLKLCGFDRSFYYNGGYLLPNVGTVNYRAPELILGFHADYGIDVWATALVIYEMATNRQLFPGFYNNDILYKHFCTVDRCPYDMLEKCYYRDQHFMGDAFVRIVGSRGEGKVLVHNFFKKDRIHSVLLNVYFSEWAKFAANKAQDKDKLFALGKLLNKMLTMDPRRRITVEFVFADPFIYEMF